MPIVGMSDRNSVQITQALPIVATIHKGAEKPERGPGRDLDYFRVEFREGFEYLQPMFVQMYGDTPRAFHNVRFVKAPVDMVFSSWMESWRGNNTLVRRCDGQQQVRYWVDGEGYKSDPIPCEAQPGTDSTGCRKGCGCKQRGRLSFMLPEFTGATGVVGLFMLGTSSELDIRKISSTLYVVEALNNGTISGIPFSLERQPQSFNRIINGKPANVTKSMVHLYANGISNLPMLPTGETEDVPELPDYGDPPDETDESPPALPDGQQDNPHWSTREDWLKGLASKIRDIVDAERTAKSGREILGRGLALIQQDGWASFETVEDAVAAIEQAYAASQKPPQA